MKLSAAIVVLFLSTSLHAASISLIGENLSLSPGGTGSIRIGVFSNDPDPPQEENLTGWQLALQTIPDEGSEGILQFTMAQLADNYILNGINFGLNSVITSNSLFALDFAPASNGRKVPTASAWLLDLSLSASQDASGSFGLFANKVSEWTDYGPLPTLSPKFGNAPIEPRQFLNLKGVESVRLGTVTISSVIVSEPASITLLAPLLLIIVLTLRKRFPLQRG